MRRTIFHLVLGSALAGLAVDADAATRHPRSPAGPPSVHAKAKGGRAEFERQEREAQRHDPCGGLNRSDRKLCEHDEAKAAEVEARRESRTGRRTAAAPLQPAAKPAREVQAEDLLGGLERPAPAVAGSGLRGSLGSVGATAPRSPSAGTRGASKPGSLREVILEDGQSLEDLAASTGVSVSDLARLNGLASPDDVPTGLPIKLPPGARRAAPPPSALAAAPAPSFEPSPSPAPPSRSTSRRELAGLAPTTGPRPYSSLGPEGATAAEPAPVRRGGRTQADALAAYAVASARAPHLADREEARHERFVWPVRAEVVSAFGPHGEGRRNDGVDLAARPGDAVRASAAGEVVYAGKEIAGTGGNLVLLKHVDGWVTAYSHLGRLTVGMRQTVDQGQEIAESPDVAGASVHFEVRQPGAGGAKPVDPVSVLPSRAAGETGRG